eukprot:gene7264-8075_t
MDQSVSGELPDKGPARKGTKLLSIVNKLKDIKDDTSLVINNSSDDEVIKPKGDDNSGQNVMKSNPQNDKYSSKDIESSDVSNSSDLDTVLSEREAEPCTEQVLDQFNIELKEGTDSITIESNENSTASSLMDNSQIPSPFIRVSSHMTIDDTPDEESSAEASAESEENDVVTVLPSEAIENDIITVLPSNANEEEKLAQVLPFLVETPRQEDEEDKNASFDLEEALSSHVMCTACGSKVKTLHGKFCKHPVLGVIVCKKCNKFYNSSSFHRDEYGMEEYCRWCGDGGDVIMCDFCEKVFCKQCIKRNMGKQFLKMLLESDDDLKWKCFACDNQQIERIAKECDGVMRFIQLNKLKEFAFESKKIHLGGPSQMQRKERLDCIAHSIEDGVALPESMLKISPDSKYVRGTEKHTARKTAHGKRNMKRSSERSREVTRTFTDKDLALLREEYSLKEFNVSVERVDVPVESIGLYENEGESVVGTAKMFKGSIGGGNSKNTCIIIDDDSDEEEVEKSVTDQIESSNMSDEDIKKESNFSLCLKEESEESNDILMKNESNSDAEQDMQSSEGEENNSILDNIRENNSESDSDSDFDKFINRSIRKKGVTDDDKRKSRKRRNESGDMSDDASSDVEGIADDEEMGDSDAQSSSRLARKAKKESAEKRRRKSDSGSDVGSRMKKRRKRPRFASKDSSESDDSDRTKGDDENESDETGRTKRTRKAKRKKFNEKKIKKKGKGRVIKNDSDSSDDEDNSPGKKGRKKIRRILGDEELTEETRKARKLEEERRKRLLERTHTLYEQDIVKVKEDTTNRIVLERSKETGEPLVQVHESLIDHLKPHQVEGVQFLYDNLFESIEKYKNGDKGSGALLAHCMGLGKTLQIITLIHAVMNSPSIQLSRVLVVAPLNTVYNWQTEFDKWLEVDERIDVHVLADAGNNRRLRFATLKTWFKNGGILILGYDMYRLLTLFKNVKSKHHKKLITETLVDPGPDLVVCDEGHILRNDLSAISQALSKIKTRRRVVLTGTPLQNNLKEYYVMVNFVKPNLLGTKKEFTNLFMNPVLNGQCSNSTAVDVRIMKQRCHVLHETLSGCVQRKDYSVLTPFLTPKHEYTIFVRLGEKQRKMYQLYLDSFVCGNLSSIRARGRSRTRRNHVVSTSDSSSSEESDSQSDNKASVTNTKPSNAIAPLREKYFSRSASSSKSSKVLRSIQLNKDIFDAESSSSSDQSDNDQDAANDANVIDTAEDIVVVQPYEEPVRGMGNTRSGAQFKGEQEGEEIIDDQEWYDEFLKDEDETDIELSGKLVLLLEVLANADIVGDKVLVFSQSLVSLDLIERVLGGGTIGGNAVNWFKGVDYFRLDGSTPAKARQRYSDIFNDPDNSTARLFLISTRAGSLGINLVAANRVIVFDCSWNPSHDVQSIFRVYRFGQTKPVYVYRFVTQGTMEQKIYERQITKLAMAGRVVDEQQIERHFTDEEIRELYTLTAEECKESEEVPTPLLPSDPILAEVLQRQHPKWITKFHEHDVLLENIEDEKLTEEERKQAWDNYQSEKDSAANSEQFTCNSIIFCCVYRQIQRHQDAIRQLANQLHGRFTADPPNVNVRHMNLSQASQLPRNAAVSVEEQYRNIQIVNLANLRNALPRFGGAIPAMTTARPHAAIPGPSNTQVRPVMHPINIPRNPAPRAVLRGVRPNTRPTDFVDLS